MHIVDNLHTDGCGKYFQQILVRHNSIGVILASKNSKEKCISLIKLPFVWDFDTLNDDESVFLMFKSPICTL